MIILYTNLIHFLYGQNTRRSEGEALKKTRVLLTDPYVNEGFSMILNFEFEKIRRNPKVSLSEEDL